MRLKAILLNYWTDNSTPILTLLAAAKLTLTARWKDKSPLLSLWIEKVSNIHIMEKLTSRLRQSESNNYNSNFAAKWFSFMIYMSVHNLIP